MPQELEVRYILPAIRKELAKIFIENHRLSQKEAAKMLGLTESAISQYQHSKRAREVAFNSQIIKELKVSAGRIISSKIKRQKLIEEMYRISNLAEVKQVLCGLHRSQSKELQNCNICFDSLIKIKTGD